MVAIDVFDAGELAETCGFLRSWILAAGAEVAGSLASVGGPQAYDIVVDALGRAPDLLVRLLPSVSRELPAQVAPLGPGEALGLTEMLLDIAEHGAPADRAYARALVEDCRGWAVRLSYIPGVPR